MRLTSRASWQAWRRGPRAVAPLLRTPPKYPEEDEWPNVMPENTGPKKKGLAGQKWEMHERNHQVYMRLFLSFAWKKLEQTASIVFIVNLQRSVFCWRFDPPFVPTWGDSMWPCLISRNFTWRNCTKSHPPPKKKRRQKKLALDINNLSQNRNGEMR